MTVTILLVLLLVIYVICGFSHILFHIIRTHFIDIGANQFDQHTCFGCILVL